MNPDIILKQTLFKEDVFQCEVSSPASVVVSPEDHQLRRYATWWDLDNVTRFFHALGYHAPWLLVCVSKMGCTNCSKPPVVVSHPQNMLPLDSGGNFRGAEWPGVNLRV